MDELPLSLANVLGACAVNGFYAGVIGNIVASGIQWAAIKSHGGLRDILLKGTGSAIKNHDLVRALVRAQLDAATQVIDITLLEDYLAEPTAAKNWITHLTYLFPTRALRDQSNEQINCLWDLRAKLENHLKGLNELTATDLDRDLVVAITDAQAIAAPDLFSGTEGPYAEWSDAAAHAMCEVLTNLATPLKIPEELRTRILSGEWTDVFRVAFREELKRDKKAQTAYFINVHDTLVHYAHQNALELGDLKTALQQGFDRQDGKLLELRNLLFSLRDHVRNLEAASDSERRQITKALEAQQAHWRNLVDEQQQHWRKAHETHQSILNQQKKTNNRLGAIENRIKEVREVLEDVRPPKSTAQQLYLEACALVDASMFEQAAIKAEEACAAAGKEREEKLRWKTSLLAARSWFNHSEASRISAATRQELETRMAKNIAEAIQAGAPAGAVALAKALVACFRQDHDETIRLATDVIADNSCDEDDRTEALTMKLQALLFSMRLDEAIDCYEEVSKLRETKGTEGHLFVEATWLRILCESQLATDDDVSYFVAAIERNVDVHPQRLLHMVDLVVRHFSIAAQEPPKQVESALVVERLSKLKRISSNIVSPLVVERLKNLEQISSNILSQCDSVLEATEAQQVEVDAGEGIDALEEALASLLDSVRPKLGDRHAQTLRLLELGYAVAKPTGDAATMVDLSSQIAEMSALRGDTAKTGTFLGYCDSWVEASKDSHSEPGREPWYSLRASALLAKGRTLYRLGWQLLRDERPAELTLFDAQASLEEANAFGMLHRAQIRGNTELFLAEASYWLGLTAVLLGFNADAATHFRSTRSPAAMAHTGFSKRVGMKAWLKEAEAHCLGGEARRAVEVVSELMAYPIISEDISNQAQRLKAHLDRHVVPVIDWFSGSNAARIREMATRQGLRAAIAAQTKYLVDWHQQFFQSQGVPNLAMVYDFWGRGGFSRIAAAIQAKPDSAIAVDAFTLEGVRSIARLLCPLFDTVIVKWKGSISPETGILVIPDPAPEGDEFGDFFGGMGLVRCSDDVLIGTGGNLLPDEVGAFLATEALPLIQSGRLILLPAPFVGCTQTAIGWTDDLLTRHLLKGVINGAAFDSGTGENIQNSINIRTPIPFIDGVSLPDLAHVLDDVSDYLVPLQGMVFGKLGSNVAWDRLAAVRSMEREFQDACRKLHEVLSASMPRHGDSNWTIKTIESAASAKAPGTTQIGSDRNSDELRSIISADKDLAPWIPFFHLQGLKGHLNWSHLIDNPSKPDVRTPYGLIQHTWIYPGTGGPGALFVRETHVSG
jgi:hypothetical protein